MSAFSFQETNFFLPYRLGSTAQSTLQEFIDIDVRVEDLVRILNANQAYRDLAFRFVNQKTAPADRRKKPKATPKTAAEEAEKQAADQPPPSPTFRLVHLLGMLGTRNLILALRCHRVAEGSFPIDAEGRVEITPSNLLKRALSVEEAFTRNRLEYSETAYACALAYDLGDMLLAKVLPAKSAQPFVQKTWERGLRTALIAARLSAFVPGFPVPAKQVLAAGFFTQHGRLLMARRFPDGKMAYPDFCEEIEGVREATPIAQALHERKTYGASQEELGAHALRYMRLFPELLQPVRYFREPYCLKGIDRESYRFALLLWLASAMARSWKIPNDEKDPIFQEWTTPGLESLKIAKAALIATMKGAMSLR
jgi:hypothetical protein